MKLELIQNSIHSLLTETKAFHPEAFKEKLYCAYRERLLNRLQSCGSAEAFKTALAENWAQVKGNAFCYTARAEDPLTLLLCEIAEEISEELHTTPISLLMPEVVTDSIYSEAQQAYQEYPDLTKLPLKEVLNTHILADSERHLIPLRILQELPSPWETNPSQFGNYHYDDGTVITEKELQRLREHSPHTQAIFTAKEAYELLLKDAGLLSHLQALIRALTFNSVAGIGTEETAGAGAYWAISQFNEYYTTLGDDVIQQIPKAVKTAIDRLKAISSDAVQNKAATENLETCVNTRQMKLSELIKAHEKELIQIKLDGNEKAALLTAAQNRFEANQDALEKQLKAKQYSGQDTLCLTHALLETYSVKPEITNPATLQDFLTLRADEIKYIATKEAKVREGILQQLPNLEALVLFCLNTPLAPLAAILSVIGRTLAEKLISPQDVSAYLMLMEGPRLEQAMQLLPAIIKSGYDFMNVLQYLNLEQCSAVCKTLKAQLPVIIKTVYDFCFVLVNLNPEQRSVVYEAVKEQLPAIIKSGYDFRQVLKYLNPEQRGAVYERLKEQLPAIIQSSNDFQMVLECLNSEQRGAVFEAVKKQLPALIKTGMELGVVLEHLNSEQRDVVYDALKMRLPAIIENTDDFIFVLKYLRADQRGAVCEAVKEQLPDIIQSLDDFWLVLQYLNFEQRSAVCEAFKEQLPTIIKSVAEFTQLINLLEIDQCESVCSILKYKILEIITSTEDKQGNFDLLKTKLSPERYAVVMKALAESTSDAEMAIVGDNAPVFTPGRKRQLEEARNGGNAENFEPALKNVRINDSPSM